MEIVIFSYWISDKHFLMQRRQLFPFLASLQSDPGSTHAQQKIKKRITKLQLSLANPNSYFFQSVHQSPNHKAFSVHIETHTHHVYMTRWKRQLTTLENSTTNTRIMMHWNAAANFDTSQTQMHFQLLDFHFWNLLTILSRCEYYGEQLSSKECFYPSLNSIYSFPINLALEIINRQNWGIRVADLSIFT
jgi:hypothetical protein